MLADANGCPALSADDATKRKTRMLVEPFKLNPFNSQYDGAYSPESMEWRRTTALDKARNINEMIKGRNIGSVLEVGCGTGSVLAALKRFGIGTSHTGIDLSDPADHLDPGARDFDIRKYDGNEVPFPNQSFDLVVATHVIEHVPNPRGILRELRRVSRNFVYVEVPCEHKIYSSRRTMQDSVSTGHINAYTPEHFLILLQTSEMNVVDLRLFDHSLEVQALGSSRLKGRVRQIIRGTALRIHPLMASRIFCYHCGALAAV